MTDFVELAARSSFSLLDAASTPESIAARASAVGMPAVALADYFDLGGSVRFTRACEQLGVRPIVGAELRVEVLPDTPRRIVLLCMDREGYHNLSALISDGRMSNPRGRPSLRLRSVAPRTEGLICLLRTDDGPSAEEATFLALHERFRLRVVRLLRELFGERFFLALEHHGLPADSRRCARWIELATTEDLPWVPVNAPRYARPDDRIVYDVLTCLRHDTTLDKAGAILLPNGEWYLKAARQMAQRWCAHAADSKPTEPSARGGSDEHSREGCTGGRACVGCAALRRTVQIADRCEFRLVELEPRLPAFQVPGGRSSDDFLRALVEHGARERYRARFGAEHRRQIEHELGIIARLQLADYFLIMWDIVRFATRRGILVQGRGSAANSAVCYCLKITAVDPIGLKLLFERFLSEERNEPPDIDLDIAHNDREEVLQYVYEKYGRVHAAMVCESITYRGRMAVRDVARVLGFPVEVADRLSEEVDRGEAADAAVSLAAGGAERAGLAPEDPETRALIRAVWGLNELPRHRSIHVGGFILSKQPLGELVPIEPASMPERTVIQWDKDDLDMPGFVKFDLLGLGMLTMLGKAIRYVRWTRGVELDLAALPPDDPAVYDMICAADTVGVFQIESRAQMNTLPRVRPRCFYDLVIEVALIRPGPIQGDMVHPYLRRRRGEEPVSYLDPRLEPVLERTLGVPLFQEQGMKVAVTLAGFTPAQADNLRRAMGFKRSHQAMESVGRDLTRGLRENGVRPEVAEKIFKQLTAFANYGFPESHAASFALLVYASSYLKYYYGPEFYCALLNSQPMGFYSPATLIHDARRHGVEIRPIDLAYSEWDCSLEGGTPTRSPHSLGSEPPRFAAGAPPRRVKGSLRGVPPSGEWPLQSREGLAARNSSLSQRKNEARRTSERASGAQRVQRAERNTASRRESATGDGKLFGGERWSLSNAQNGCSERSGTLDGGGVAPALRIGLRYVRGLGKAAKERLQAALAAGPFESAEDVVRRSGLGQAELRTLAEAGAFETLWPGRRQALWELLRQARGDAGPLAPRPVARGLRRLPEMTEVERMAADYRSTGLSVDRHPMEFLRKELAEAGVLSARQLAKRPNGDRVSVGGIVICRQRPGTAKGVMFITLEDETGFSNFVVMPDVQGENRATLLRSPLLLLEGTVESQEGVVNVRVDTAQHLDSSASEGLRSRDFR